MAKVGIIGTGWGSRVQVPLFRKAGLEVVGIAGRDAARTSAVAAELGVGARSDWRAIVDDPAIDLVSIVTPPVLHREIAIAALEAGRHVLCEKPTAMNAAEAREMLRQADARPETIALIDHELRFLPSWGAARQRIAEVGRVRFVEMRFSSPSRGDASRAWNWWSDAAQGGGVWGAVGSHFVDAIRYLVGEIDAAQSVEKTFIGERPSPDGARKVTADDFAAVHLRLANGGIAVLSFSAVSAVDEPSVVTIHGENGGIRLESDQWWLADRGRKWVQQPVDQGDLPDDAAKIPGNSPGGWFGSGTWHLAKALRRAFDERDASVLSPAATFADGLEQQRVLDAARASAAGDGGWRAVGGRSRTAAPSDGSSV
jgi:predicted dehydrogenase